MERRIQRSVLVDDEDHYYLSNGSKPVKSESCERAYDASSSRRLAIRESHVLAANLHTPDFGKCHVLASISRILATS
jgi:hypothetical protein